jgi:hypothetical protein
MKKFWILLLAVVVLCVSVGPALFFVNILRQK